MTVSNKQKALSVVCPLSKQTMLKQLKDLHDRSTYESMIAFTSSIEAIKNCLGWQDMTKEDRQKINDYLKSEDNS